MGIIVYLMHRYSGGMRDSKVVWKRLKMKPERPFSVRNEGLIAKVRKPNKRRTLCDCENDG